MNHALGNPEVATLIDTAAYSGYRKYSEWVSYKQLREFVWQYAMCTGVVDDDKPSISFIGLVRYAHKRAALAKAQGIRRAENDQVKYTPGMVRELLHDAADPTWTNQAATSTGRGGGDPAVSGNYIAAVMDVRRAFKSLTFYQRRHLFFKVVMKRSSAELAAEAQCTVRAVDAVVERAVKAICAHLNGGTARYPR
ncbi:hypothetical protein [Longispora urticae]